MSKGRIGRTCIVDTVKGRIKNLRLKIVSPCATQQTIHVTDCQSYSAPSLTSASTCRRAGRLWPLANNFHGMPAEGKYAHLPSFVCGPAPNPHWIILLSLHRAKGHRPFASERWSREWTINSGVWRRGDDREGTDQRAARAICQSIDEEQSGADGSGRSRWRWRDD